MIGEDALQEAYVLLIRIVILIMAEQILLFLN